MGEVVTKWLVHWTLARAVWVEQCCVLGQDTLSLVFTSDASTSASTSAITPKGQILILLLVLAAMGLSFCLSQSRFHGEKRAVIRAVVLAALVKTRLYFHSASLQSGV